MEGILTAWGLSSYIPVFQENEVTYDSLLLMTEATVKELIPKLGPRVIFLEKLSKLQKGEGSATSSKDVPVDRVNSEARSTNVGSAGTECVPGPSAGSSSSLLGLIRSSSGLASSSSTKPLSATCSGAALQNDSAFLDAQIDGLDFETIFQEDELGQPVLEYFRSSGTVLPKGRTVITHVVTNALLKISKRLSKDHFCRSIKKLVALFTCERIETYYVTPNPQAGQPVPKGLVYNLYKYLKSRKRGLNPSVQEEDSNPDEPLVASVAKRPTRRNLPAICYEKRSQEEVDGATAFLLHSRSPWPDVLKSWKITAPSRIASLFPAEEKNKNKKKKTCTEALQSAANLLDEYLKKWPVLRHASGHELLLADFAFLYPDHELTFFSRWDSFATKVVKAAKKYVTDDFGKQLLIEINSKDSTKGYADVLTALLLPSLVPPTTRISKPSGGFWKPSISESRDGFILHVKSITDINTALKRRYDFLNQVGVRGQPLFIIVGPSLRQLRHFVISVDDTRYTVCNFLQGLDLLFKIFHSLHCLYPVECKQVYLFLQLGLYEIRTSWDETIPKVTTMLNEL